MSPIQKAVGFISVDFHTHTVASRDSLTSPRELVRKARWHGLDKVVVTDHNTIEGALAAQAIAPELVIIGEEIMTVSGEILAAFVTQTVPPGMPAMETIRLLREQGAFISVSHPFDAWRKGSWDVDELARIAPLVDAVEVFNARCFTPDGNQKALQFSRDHQLQGTAGSDAHAGFELGAAGLMLPAFEDADGLRQGIKDAIVRGRLSPFWVHFFSRYASWKKIRLSTGNDGGSAGK